MTIDGGPPILCVLCTGVGIPDRNVYFLLWSDIFTLLFGRNWELLLHGPAWE